MYRWPVATMADCHGLPSECSGLWTLFGEPWHWAMLTASGVCQDQTLAQNLGCAHHCAGSTPVLVGTQGATELTEGAFCSPQVSTPALDAVDGPSPAARDPELWDVARHFYGGRHWWWSEWQQWLQGAEGQYEESVFCPVDQGVLEDFRVSPVGAMRLSSFQALPWHHRWALVTDLGPTWIHRVLQDWLGRDEQCGEFGSSRLRLACKSKCPRWLSSLPVKLVKGNPQVGGCEPFVST